jgi:hypothetical protein
MLNERSERPMDLRAREQRPDSFEKGTRRNQPNANTQHDDDEIALGVVAILERMVPSVEGLYDRGTETDTQQKRGEQVPQTSQNNAENTMPEPHLSRTGIVLPTSPVINIRCEAVP